MSNSKISENNLDQGRANQFIHFLWVAFNNVNMYGTDHPLANRGVENFHSFLKDTLEKVDPVTIHVDGENVLCEKWKTSLSMNMGRLVERLKSAGINSISFQKDVSQDDIMETFRIITDAKSYQNIEAISEALKGQDIKSIDLNTFVYKRVSVDEVVEEKSPERIRSVELSSEERDKRFEEVAKSLMEQFFIEDSDGRFSFLDQMEILRERCTANKEDTSKLPTDELLNILMYLKSLRSGEADATFETGHGAKPGKEIFFEFELLTFELVTKFIQDKYRSDTLSVKQFGSIIKNLFPDSNDLKILFPKIKEVLLANGMTLPDYLKFVHDTSIELEEGGFLNLIEEIGGDIGVSVKEVTEDLKKNPLIPVELIILTFKIFSLLGVTRDQILSVLSQSIGLIIKSKTMENVRSSNIDDIKEIRKSLSEEENQFLHDLESEGINKEILQNVKNHLAQRSNLLLGQVWSERIIDRVTENRDMSDPELMEMISEIIQNDKDSKSFLSSLLIVLEEKGFKKELLDELIEKITQGAADEEKEKIKPGKISKTEKKISYKLPKEISNLKETRKYLQAEIYRNHRHKTSFSCISISVTQVRTDQENRPPTNAELSEIIQIMAKILIHSQRKIDFIGSLGTLKDNHVLVIMTMTDKSGCQKAEERIASLLSDISVLSNESIVKPEMVLSAMSFDQEKTPEIKTLVRRVKATHRKKTQHLKNTLKK